MIPPKNPKPTKLEEQHYADDKKPASGAVHGDDTTSTRQYGGTGGMKDEASGR